MKSYIFLVFHIFICTKLLAQDRYWVHKPFYQNFFSSASELSEWDLIEDDGTGGFALSGTGTAILTMDGAAGNYANRLFSVNGGSARFLPLDSIYGRLDINILQTTGGNQRFFVQAQTFTTANAYINQITILPATTGKGFFSVDMRGLPWPANADKIRLIFGGENYSAQQGTIIFDYINYSNTDGGWSNAANWAATSNGVAGATVPGPGNSIVFDGAGNSNGSCQLDIAASVAGIVVTSGYSGNIDLQKYALTVNAGGIVMNGGGVSGGSSDLLINGNVTIGAGTYKSSTATTTVTGDVAVTGGNLDMGQGTLVFDGSPAQSFGSATPTAIHRVIINKGTGTLNLTSDLPVLDSLELTSGVVTTNAFALSVGTSSINPGLLFPVGTGSVEGTFRKWISAGFTGTQTFPLGTSAVTAPIAVTVDAAATSGGNISITYNEHGNQSATVNFADGGSTITSRYLSNWSINVVGITDGTYSLSASPGNLGYAGSVNDFHMVLNSGTIGTHSPASGTSGNPTLYRNNLSAASLSQTFFPATAAASLPVNWFLFRVENAGGVNVLEWKVREFGNRYYEIQRSDDGLSFTGIGNIVSQGDGEHEYYFKDIRSVGAFYRIMQVDMDAQYSYSIVIRTHTSETNNWTITKVDGGIRLWYSGKTASCFSLYNTQGQLLKTISYPTSGQFVFSTYIRSGIYIAVFKSEKITSSKKIFIP